MRTCPAVFLLGSWACAAPAPPDDQARPDTDLAEADTDRTLDTDLGDSDPPCVPFVTLGTGEGSVFSPVADGATLSVHFGAQGGFHVFGGVRFSCVGPTALGRFAVLASDGAQIAGNTDLIPLDVIADCSVDSDGVVTCAGQQIVFTVPNPDVGDAAFFGASYRLAADISGAGHAEVSVRLSDPRTTP